MTMRTKGLLALFLVCGLQFSALAHEQKTALTDILFNYRTGNLEIAHRLSLHDAEHTLYKATGLDEDLTQSAKAREAFAKYVAERFHLSSKGSKKWKLTMVGQEIDRGFLWVYQEIPIPTSISTFSIENKILHNVVKGQVNTLNVRNKGKVTTFVFEADTGTLRYSLPPNTP
jgi:hypothetical protein